MLTRKSMIGTISRSYSSKVATKTTAKSWANFSNTPFEQNTKMANNLIVASSLLVMDSAAFTINLPAGSRYEQQPGTAHYLKNALFMVIFVILIRFHSFDQKSNQTESSLAMARLQELRASQTSVSLSRDLISVTFQCPLEHL